MQSDIQVLYLVVWLLICLKYCLISGSKMHNDFSRKKSSFIKIMNIKYQTQKIKILSILYCQVKFWEVILLHYVSNSAESAFDRFSLALSVNKFLTFMYLSACVCHTATMILFHTLLSRFREIHIKLLAKHINQTTLIITVTSILDARFKHTCNEVTIGALFFSLCFEQMEWSLSYYYIILRSNILLCVSIIHLVRIKC